MLPSSESLKRAGYDGLIHDDGVNPDIPNRSLVVFPESIDKIRNKFTGDIRGAGPDKAPSGWGNVGDGPGEAEQLAEATIPERQRAFSVSGSVVGGLTGAAAGDENTTPQERLQRGLLGAAGGATVGGVLGSSGVRRAGRLIDEMIASGKLPIDQIETHSDALTRIRAMFALAAANKAPDEIVDVPGMASFARKAFTREGEIRPEDIPLMDAFFDHPLTAREVLEMVQQPNVWQRVQREIQDVVADAVTGVNRRGSRAAEDAADRASVLPLSDNLVRSAQDLDKKGASGRPQSIRTPYGVAELTIDPEVTRAVDNAADELGLPILDVYVTKSPEINAAAGVDPRTGQQRVIINQGLLDAGFSKEELNGLLRHELSHVAERSDKYLNDVIPSRLAASSPLRSQEEMDGLLAAGPRRARPEDSANPYIKDLARQMRGEYTKDEGKTQRPIGERLAQLLTDRTAIGANLDAEAKEKTPSLVTRLKERLRVNAASIGNERLEKEIAPALKEVGDDVDNLAIYLTLRHNKDIADQVERSIQQGVLDKNLPADVMTADERRRFEFAKREKGLAEASEGRLSEAVTKADENLTTAKQDLDKVTQAIQQLAATNANLTPQTGASSSSWMLAVGQMAANAAGETVESKAAKLKALNVRRAQADMRVARAEERIKAAKEALAKNQEERRIANEAKRTERAAVAGATARAERRFSGGDIDDVEKALEDLRVKLEEAGTWDNVESAAQKIWAANRNTLERKMKSGQITQELFDDLTSAYPHYVRTDIADYFDNATSSSGPRPGGNVMGISDVGIKRLSKEGTDKDRVNPIMSTIDSIYAGESSIVRQEAGKDMLTIRDSDPSFSKMFKEVATDGRDADGNYVSSIDVYNQNKDTMVPHDYTPMNGEKKLTVWNDGKAVQLIIPAEYAELVSPEAGGLLGDGKGWQAIRTAMGVVKAGMTTHNPSFQFIVSPIRDASDAMISMSARAAQQSRREGASAFENALREAGVGAGYMLGPALYRYLSAIPEAMKGITSGTHSARVNELMSAGAGFQSRVGRDEKSLRRAMTELHRTGGLEVKSLGDVARVTRNVLTLGAEPIGARLEMIGRIAAANQERAYGGDLMKQSMAYKDATIDFLRGGTAVRQLNVPLMFLNATVQSGAQVQRKMKMSPAGYLGAVTAGIALPTMAIEAWNRSDPERAKRYEDRPQYLKDTGLIFELPDAALDNSGGMLTGEGRIGEKQPNYIWIPLGSHAYIARAAREALSAADNVTGLNTPESENPGVDWNDPLSVAGHYAAVGASLVGSFSPIKGGDVSSALGSIIPPGFKEGIELGVGKDLYRHNTIVTDRADENASALSQGISSAAQSFGQEWRPSAVEHTLRGSTGYAGQLATGASDVLTGRDRPGERPVQDIPVVGAMAGRILRDNGGQRLENTRDPAVRLPSSVRAVLKDAGMWTSDLQAVPSRYQDAPLTRDEQADWQRAYNNYARDSLERAARSSQWNNPASREKVVRDALTEARDKAAKQALRIPASTLNQRKREEAARK